MGATSPRERTTALGRLFTAVDMAFYALLLAGVAAALLGWGPGVVAVLAGFVCLLALHLVGGALAYRRVMRRPWPQVEPLEDDEDW